ncbi:pentapeptide repeat-containing protein [Sporosarcina sp. Te-1]|uniref:pentapeptide repeat-containing protein n=1 Tax=Sporosarcina sp. Te-1 TaxID=2818390 RepID=UPI001A9F012F|nr:pentapeptide repeat-containing protein [Sporosarcina sp. Te-1]QTD43172.1 pentapeptide repeat-containing protein [Sporosarcina sp. Te-1]
MSQLEIKSEHRPNALRSDCTNCFALCCVALPFAASADFAFHKDGGTPCRNLQSDFRCSIHMELREKGCNGCVSYECFGAGQKVSQTIFKGNDWRTAPETASSMYAVFPLVQQLHEMLYYLSDALSRDALRDIHGDLQAVYEEIEQLTELPVDQIVQLDVPIHRVKVNELLLVASERIRSNAVMLRDPARMPKKKAGKGTDLIGANFRNTDIRGMNFRGALLIGADFRQADLRETDMIGADLRAANLNGADLRGSLFLTQAQLNSATGDKTTKIPLSLLRPAHWTSKK